MVRKLKKKKQKKPQKVRKNILILKATCTIIDWCLYEAFRLTILFTTRTEIPRQISLKTWICKIWR